MSKEDCEGICILMESGFSFQDAIRLLKDSRNEKVISKIQECLSEGNEIEMFVTQYFSKTYLKYLEPFCKFLPFSRSLQLTVKCLSEEKNTRSNLLKELLYPILLFIGTWIGLFIFTFFCFPTLISLFRNFSMSITNLVVIKSCFMIVCITISIINLLTLVLLIGCRQNYIRLYLYSKICRLFKNNLLKTYQSNLFARFYRQCSLAGIKTKQTMKLLQSIEIHPVLVLISKQVEKSLNEGETMEDSLKNNLLDRTLIQYMKLAIYSSTMDEMLEGYIKVNEERMHRTIKRFSKGCQLISYGCIGFIIIVVYQILILPLTLMAEL